MDVQLIDYTGKGRSDERWHAANMLMFTKATRLNMTPDLLEQIQAMPREEALKELEYMANTIPSSHEFADCTFLISGVSRATAQQITRTRTASFAMQSQRVTDVRDARVVNPIKDAHRASKFHAAAAQSIAAYEDLVDNYDVSRQDARGVLPMNIECNLVAKYNFRALCDMLRARSSLRVQGEYADMVAQMKAAVCAVWPWAEMFWQPKNAQAIAILEEEARRLGTEPNGEGWQIAKAIDLLRGA